MEDTSLSLSDEDFMKQAPPPEVTEVPVETNTPEETPAGESDSSSDDEASSDSSAQEQPEAKAVESEVGQPEGDTPTEREPLVIEEAEDSINTLESDEQDTEGDTPETEEFDYKSAYEKVSQPFKANGVDMQVKDPKDIIALMQKGANYQKKMAQLKPNLKIVKMLENNGLLDEKKLHNLIDLSKKDPKAVAKLIEESGIDPLDIDTDGSKDYQPTNYSVTDKEYQLDQVLDSIKDTGSFTKTINVLTKEWDEGSKATISDNPDIIGIINAHMENGVYDKVNEAMQQEKTLGRLDGVPDVEAYRQIAEHLLKEGVLGGSPTKEQEQKKPDKKVKATADRKKMRKAVAPIKHTSSSKTISEDDFLGLSDEEFMKKFA